MSSYKDYIECIEYLFNSLPMYQRIGAAAYKDNLDNTLALMQHLDNPQNKFQSIHVGGTNGKGSVSHNLASIYQQAGYKAGLYTSPHLRDFRERIRINGKKISPKFIFDFTTENKPFFEELKPSFFEMSVAMAFAYFAKHQVDIAIIEVGMGGRLDSTNVITPQLSIITNISYDHTQFLGNTLEDIAREKAGIIKENIPVIIGETQTETAEIFTQIAKEKNAPIFFADKLFQIEKSVTELGHRAFHTKFKVKYNAKSDKYHWGDYFTPLTGKCQLNNIKTVLTACQVLGKGTFLSRQIRDGIKNCIKNTGLMGRWQVLRKRPLCIVDTAHNAAGMKYVVEQIQEIEHDNLHIILGVVNDKDISEMLSILPKNARYYSCKAKIPRGLSAKELKKQAKEFGLYGTVYKSVINAYNSAKKRAEKSDLIFIGGSNFTVAEVLLLK